MINFELIEINRNNFLNKLISFKDKQLIKVISGVRRCGKSTLMQQFIKYLFTLGINEEQIIFINFEDFENRDLLNLDNFYKYVSSKIIKDKKMYLFFDEIQQVKDFQKVVDSFYIKKNIDIYLTGSNSTLLSGELATLLTGRYVEIKMLPLSFKEFSSVMKEENIQKTYKEYVETSSFPYVFSLWDSKQNITEYLDGLFNSIVLRDIVKRKNISDIKMFLSVCEFIFDNIGLEVSSKKIADTMTALRTNPPASIAGIDVVTFKDILNSTAVDVSTNEKTNIDLPKSNVLCFYLSDGSSLIVRPSGTEPKIKIYISAVGSTADDADKKKALIEQAGTDLLNL
jgi:predicted AAA+ superfamily ATPase